MQAECVSSGDHIVGVMGRPGSEYGMFSPSEIYIPAYGPPMDRAIGHGLRAVSSDIQIDKTNHPVDHHPVVFLDTPSFDAYSNSGVDILCQIANWLKSHGENSNLAAIIYLHPISDNRMSGLLRNLHIFASLCGQQAIPYLTIVTTMRGEVPEETGARREKESEKVFWGDMVGNGCKTKRFEDTFESALGIVGKNPGTAPRFPEGLGDTGKALGNTEPYDPRKDDFSNWITMFKEAVRKALLRSQTAITFTQTSTTQPSNANFRPTRPPLEVISLYNAMLEMNAAVGQGKVAGLIRYFRPAYF